jgi:hypothetical protein
MKRTILAITVICILSSCATHQGTMNISTIDNNIIYQRTAIGVSQSNRILGIGGGSRDALIYDAKRELFKNYPIQANESYMNFTLDIKNTKYILYAQTKITVKADIIKTTTDSNTQPFSDSFINQLGRNDFFKSELFEIGDTIIFDNSKKGVIISFPKFEQAKILIISEQESLQSKDMSIYDIYTNNKDFKGYKIGEYFVIEEEVSDKLIPKAWTIIATGENTLLIQSPDNKEFKKVKYK